MEKKTKLCTIWEVDRYCFTKVTREVFLHGDIGSSSVAAASITFSHSTRWKIVDAIIVRLYADTILRLGNSLVRTKVLS